MSLLQIVKVVAVAVGTGVKIGADAAKIVGKPIIKGGLKGGCEAVKLIVK